MFKRKKMKKTDYTNDNIITIIGEGTNIEGIITASSSARIDGTLKGEAKLYKNLIIGEKGYINGTVSAPNIVVHGKIEGQVKADTLEIKSDGTVIGDINVETLNIESGGVFNGNSVMNAVGESAGVVPQDIDDVDVTSMDNFKSQK